MSDPHESEPIAQSTIDSWRINYGLDKRTPAEAARWWHENMQGFAPSAAVAALGVALDALEEAQKDAERYRWLRRSGATVARTMRPGEEREHVEVDAGQWTRRPTLDAAIDAAIAPPKEQP